MEERILAYRKHVDELLQQENADWEKILEEHLIQIGFFQHERLVHLIVTITFALLEMMALGLTILAFTPALMILTVLVMILLIPYIKHYYVLENETQKMYKQYDELLRKREM